MEKYYAIELEEVTLTTPKGIVYKFKQLWNYFSHEDKAVVGDFIYDNKLKHANTISVMDFNELFENAESIINQYKDRCKKELSFDIDIEVLK